MQKLTQEQKSGTRDALLSSAVYGFGFIATKIALDVWSPMTVTFTRLFIAALAGFVLMTATKKTSDLKSHWIVAIVPGLFFAIELFTIALALLTTSVSNGAFIANTYVVLVPFFIAFNPFSMDGLRHILFIALALLGVAMASEFATVSLTNTGDFLCLLTSVVTAGHIIAVQRSEKLITSPMAFNVCQCTWGALFLGAGMFFVESGNPYTDSTLIVWLSVVSAALLSTLLAITLQVRAQMRIGASAASLLFLMDAPFATLFGMLIFQERLSFLQILGAGVILGTSLGQFYFDWKITKINSKKEQDTTKENLKKDIDNVA